MSTLTSAKSEPLIAVARRRADESATPAMTLAERQGLILGVMADALDQGGYRDAAIAAVTRLASVLQCDRVSLGTLYGKRLVLDALSHSAEFEVKSSLARSLAEAMEEARAQGCTIVYPAPSSLPIITLAHKSLCRSHGTSVICTVPLVVERRIIGALTLERSRPEGFTEDDIQLTESAAVLLAPVLKLKQRAEDPLHRRVVASLSATAAAALGPHHLGAKLMLIATVCVAALALTVNGDYRVTADAALEAHDRRAVVAPVAGFIANVHKRAGETVSKGTPLAQLDQRDLSLELENWQTELSKNAKEQRAALAGRDRSQLRILESREHQIRAQIRLVQNFIDRAELVSPVEGVVLSADPNLSFGSPVEQGQVLFEVAPRSSHRLILKIDERDVSEVTVGDEGRLVLSPRPFEPLRFTISNITPISDSRDGQNTFRVEGELIDRVEWVSTGMQGVAKLDIGKRRLGWIWTHRIGEAIALRWWRWGWS